MHSAWPNKTGLLEHTQKAVKRRADGEIEWLRNRSEKVIAVVSHSAFMRTSVAHAFFANGSYRIFGFEEDGAFVEWDRTRLGGGGMGTSRNGRAEIKQEDFPEG